MRGELGLYSDLDLSFVPHPLTGDLTPKKDAEAVSRAVKHLVFWNEFDKPFDATLKSNVKRYLFEQNNQITRSNLEDDLKWVLKSLEPRIKVNFIKVLATQDGRAFDITINYSMVSLNREGTANFIIERVR